MLLSAKNLTFLCTVFTKGLLVITQAMSGDNLFNYNLNIHTVLYVHISILMIS